MTTKSHASNRPSSTVTLPQTCSYLASRLVECKADLLYCLTLEQAGPTLLIDNICDSSSTYKPITRASGLVQYQSVLVTYLPDLEYYSLYGSAAPSSLSLPPGLGPFLSYVSTHGLDSTSTAAAGSTATRSVAMSTSHSITSTASVTSITSITNTPSTAAAAAPTTVTTTAASSTTIIYSGPRV